MNIIGENDKEKFNIFISRELAYRDILISTGVKKGDFFIRHYYKDSSYTDVGTLVAYAIKDCSGYPDSVNAIKVISGNDIFPVSRIVSTLPDVTELDRGEIILFSNKIEENDSVTYQNYFVSLSDEGTTRQIVKVSGNGLVGENDTKVLNLEDGWIYYVTYSDIVREGVQRTPTVNVESLKSRIKILEDLLYKVKIDYFYINGNITDTGEEGFYRTAKPAWKISFVDEDITDKCTVKITNKDTGEVYTLDRNNSLGSFSKDTTFKLSVEYVYGEEVKTAEAYAYMKFPYVSKDFRISSFELSQDTANDGDSVDLTVSYIVIKGGVVLDNTTLENDYTVKVFKSTDAYETEVRDSNGKIKNVTDTTKYCIKVVGREHPDTETDTREKEIQFIKNDLVCEYFTVTPSVATNGFQVSPRVDYKIMWGTTDITDDLETTIEVYRQGTSTDLLQLDKTLNDTISSNQTYVLSAKTSKYTHAASTSSNNSVTFGDGELRASLLFSDNTLEKPNIPEGTQFSDTLKYKVEFKKYGETTFEDVTSECLSILTIKQQGSEDEVIQLNPNSTTQEISGIIKETEIVLNTSYNPGGKDYTDTKTVNVDFTVGNYSFEFKLLTEDEAVPIDLDEGLSFNLVPTIKVKNGEEDITANCDWYICTDESDPDNTKVTLTAGKIANVTSGGYYYAVISPKEGSGYTFGEGINRQIKSQNVTFKAYPIVIESFRINTESSIVYVGDIEICDYFSYITYRGNDITNNCTLHVYKETDTERETDLLADENITISDNTPGKLNYVLVATYDTIPGRTDEKTYGVTFKRDKLVVTNFSVGGNDKDLLTGNNVTFSDISYNVKRQSEKPLPSSNYSVSIYKYADSGTTDIRNASGNIVLSETTSLVCRATGDYYDYGISSAVNLIFSNVSLVFAEFSINPSTATLEETITSITPTITVRNNGNTLSASDYTVLIYDKTDTSKTNLYAGSGNIEKTISGTTTFVCEITHTSSGKTVSKEATINFGALSYYGIVNYNSLGGSVEETEEGDSIISISISSSNIQTIIESLTPTSELNSSSFDYTGISYTTDQTVFYIYPKNYGELTEINDGTYDLLNDFNKSEVQISGEDYYVYYKTNSVNASNVNIYFS